MCTVKQGCGSRYVLPVSGSDLQKKPNQDPAFEKKYLDPVHTSFLFFTFHFIIDFLLYTVLYILANYNKCLKGFKTLMFRLNSDPTNFEQ